MLDIVYAWTTVLQEKLTTDSCLLGVPDESVVVGARFQEISFLNQPSCHHASKKVRHTRTRYVEHKRRL